MKATLPLVICAATLAPLLLTQNLSPGVPDRNALAKDPKLFLELARKADHWDEPTDPVQIAGPLYFIGSKGLGVYLIKSSEGLILINTGMPGSGPLTAASIMRLGFDPKELKILLTGHAHVDHAGAMAYFKQTYGAKVGIMKEEKELLESGGRTDFQYGDYRDFAFEPVQADIVFSDGGQIKLGDITITALLTNGHTKGSTTFVTNITDNGKTYNVVFPNGLSINPGYRLASEGSYPGIAGNYRRTLQILASLRPDIWLAPHNETYKFEQKRALAAKEGASAWVDPEGYQEWLVDQRKEVEDAIGEPVIQRTGEASRTK